MPDWSSFPVADPQGGDGRRPIIGATDGPHCEHFRELGNRIDDLSSRVGEWAVNPFGPPQPARWVPLVPPRRPRAGPIRVAAWRSDIETLLPHFFAADGSAEVWSTGSPIPGLTRNIFRSAFTPPVFAWRNVAAGPIGAGPQNDQVTDLQRVTSLLRYYAEHWAPTDGSLKCSMLVGTWPNYRVRFVVNLGELGDTRFIESFGLTGVFYASSLVPSGSVYEIPSGDWAAQCADLTTILGAKCCDLPTTYQAPLWDYYWRVSGLLTHLPDHGWVLFDVVGMGVYVELAQWPGAPGFVIDWATTNPLHNDAWMRIWSIGDAGG